ncbi:MAG: glycoside hydrolase family 25 protein [Oscillospiraceae bacterium]|nr:glycoside hydrolase family 25 protein [Oscillospiraceae bacterium]
MQYKGIDVSHHNGVVDWDKVKAAGIQFAILRCGYGRKSIKQVDRQFERNYRECKRVGMPVGVYHYSYAKTAEDARLEADFMLELIAGKQFEYPVIFDIEDKTQQALGKKVLTDITVAFCEKIEAAGYYTAVYSNVDWFINKLDRSRLEAYDKWLAHWVTSPRWGNEFGGLWQYSDSGRVDGIETAVDMNISYRDYPSIIKRAGLNGCGKTTYRITAVKGGMNSTEADLLAKEASALGMTVVKKEE